MSPRAGAASSRSSSAIVSTSGSASRFFGVRSGRAGSRSSCSSSTRKRNDFSAAVARAWLEGAGLPFASSARKARRSSAAPRRDLLTPHLADNPDKPKHHARMQRTSAAPGGARRRKTQEIRQFFLHRSSFGQPPAPAGVRLTTLRLTGLLWENPAFAGFSYWRLDRRAFTGASPLPGTARDSRDFHAAIPLFMENSSPRARRPRSI